MTRAIGLVSGKGGVGKTTVTANLGAALTNVFKKNVVLVDMNVRSSHLGLHLGMYKDPPVTLRDVLMKKTSAIHAIYTHYFTGIRIVSAPLNGQCGSVTQSKIKNLVNQIGNSYDMVLVDCAPGLGKEAMVAMNAVDEALVVTTPDISAITDAMKALEILRKMNKNVLGIVLNRCENQSYMLTQNEVESTCNCNVISKIPEDKKIPESIARGIPAVLLYPNSPSSRSLKGLAGYLCGESYYEEGLWERIKDFLGIGKIVPILKQERIPEVRQIEEKEIERQEVVDIEELKREIAEEVKEELKKEIIKKVRKRLKERYAR